MHDSRTRLPPWVLTANTAARSGPYTGPAPVTRYSGSESVACAVARVPLGPRPSLRPLRSQCSGLVRRLHRYYGGVRLLGSVHHRLRLLAFPMRASPVPQLVRPEISRFPYKERAHMPGSPTTPGRLGACSNAPSRVAFRYSSRRVLAHRVSISMDASFCVEALEEALAKYGQPEILNSDQGSQFTGEAFTDVLKDRGVAISMDGKGAWRDNIFVERLWRSIKYEEVYLHAYDSVAEARAGLARYIDFYNTARPHSSLDKKTPDEFYFATLPALKQAA